MCEDARLEDSEVLLLEAADAQVKRWHQRARAGDDGARDRLLRWAYAKARYYYCCIATQGENGLHLHEAEELAGGFVLTFERKWRDVDQVLNYTAATLKRSVQFYRYRQARVVKESFPEEPSVDPPEVDALTDEQRLELLAVQAVLKTSNPVTRQIILWRTTEVPTPTFDTIAARLSIEVGAVKMRWQRFKAAVHRRHRRML